MNEASPIAEAELRCDEANRSEQLPAGAQWELQVMNPNKETMKLTSFIAIAPNGSKNLESTTLWSRDETTLLKEGEDSG